MTVRDPATLTPRALVAELDRYIIGQKSAKRAVSIAMRNRWRRQSVEGPLREEISPKNIILVGPTGVGKTEIARRLARLSGAPFVKVEVSKFTEVGYVGRDVDSVVRDLVEAAAQLVKSEMASEVASEAKRQAEERLLDALLPASGRPADATPTGVPVTNTRERLRELLRDGKLDDRDVEIEVTDSVPSVEMPGGMGAQMGQQLQDLFGKLGRTKKAANNHRSRGP